MSSKILRALCNTLMSSGCNEEILPDFRLLLLKNGAKAPDSKSIAFYLLPLASANGLK
jgi:hypothetical protein